jgi:hypothetical protein
MATAVTASYAAGDMSEQRLRRPTHVYQSILPLRRERTIADEEFIRNRQSKSGHSSALSVRSSAFAGGMNDSFVFLDKNQIYFLKKSNTIDVKYQHSSVQPNPTK